MAACLQRIWSRFVKWSTGKGSKDVDSLQRDQVSSVIDSYNEMYNERSHELGESKHKKEERMSNYAKVVNAYYDLSTDFYEWGWGQSFHFAPTFKGEGFAASLARHEHFLALRSGLRSGMKALDVGCGVGGPMREIARFTGAHVTGINNNAYQVKRCGILNEQQRLSQLCEAVKGDFMKLPFEANSFDVVYAIEATCHAPDKVGCYSQIFKVLKPGGVFVGYEWVMTEKYDAKDPDHRRIKHLIEKGDGLPDLAQPKDVVDALIKSGFAVEEKFDLADTAPPNGNPLPWYSTLEGAWTPSQFKHTPLGRRCTQKFCEFAELIHLAPKGTGKTHAMLTCAADGIVDGGRLGVFTPMYFFMARKPRK